MQTVESIAVYIISSFTSDHSTGATHTTMARVKRIQRNPSTKAPPAPKDGARDNRTSSIFPYSVARPPTDFAPPIPDSPITASPQPEREASPPAIRVEQQDPFGDDETIMDPRETPLYARSDWDPTTGNGAQTAWFQSTYPDYADQVSTTAGEGRRGGREMLGDGNPIAAAPTTAWSRSSYASNVTTPPPLPVTEPLAVRKTRSPDNQGKINSPEVKGDPYITQPGTAWSQASFRSQSPAQLRASQIGTTIQLQPTPMTPKPSHTIPLTSEDRKPAQPSQSKQLVSNNSYGSALKSAGSRKPSQLVDITELSETSHPEVDSLDGGHGQTPRASAGYAPPTGDSIRLKAGTDDGIENPFSPMFVNTPIAPTAPDSQSQTGMTNTHQQGHKHNRSTLPSILDLEDLAARPRQSQSPRLQTRPQTAHASGSRPGPGDFHRTYSADSLEPPRMIGMGRPGTDSPRLLTPEAQNRLGRMSVATARYSLPPSRNTHSNPSRGSNQDTEKTRLSPALSLGKPLGWWNRCKNTGVIKWYRTWRPFITAFHTLMAALLLTTAMADQGSGLGWLLKIQAGGLATMPATGGFGLGINGWCQLDEDE